MKKQMSTLAVILWLIFFFPLGLYFMWHRSSFDIIAKWIITGFFALVLIGNYNALNDKNNEAIKPIKPNLVAAKNKSIIECWRPLCANEKFITKNGTGKDWPLSDNSCIVMYYDRGVLIETRDGKQYTVNGMAKMMHPELNNLTKSNLLINDPLRHSKKSLDVIIKQGYSLSKSMKQKEEDEEFEAFYASKEFVEKRLISPSSADFPMREEAVVTPLSIDKWLIVSYVDSQNAFGAQIRKYYACKLKYNPKSKEWLCLEIAFQ